MKADGVCKSCRAEIRWAQHHVTGNRMPLDPLPVDDGNICVVGWIDSHDHTPIVAVNKPELATTRFRYVSHFVTCPNAAEHRKEAQRHPCPTCSGLGTVSDEHFRRLIEDRQGQVRHDSPSTSRRAASANFRFGSQRYRILELLTLRDATAYELGLVFGMSPNQIATRLGELRDAALVEYVRDDKGEVVERETTSGNTGRVQRITNAGRAALESRRRT